MFLTLRLQASGTVDALNTSQIQPASTKVSAPMASTSRPHLNIPSTSLAAPSKAASSSVNVLSAANGSHNGPLASGITAFSPPVSSNSALPPAYDTKANASLSAVTPVAPSTVANTSAQTSSTGLKPPASTNTFWGWARNSPPNSYFPMPKSQNMFYKALNGVIMVVNPDGKGGYSPDNSATLQLQGSMAKAAANLIKDDKGIYWSSAVPPAGTQGQVYRPYNERFHYLPAQTSVKGQPAPNGRPVPVSSTFLLSQSSGQFQAYPPNTPIPPSTSTADNSANAPNQSIMRTPKDADKTRLAKDILRSLGFPSAEQKEKKRRQDDELMEKSLNLKASDEIISTVASEMEQDHQMTSPTMPILQKPAAMANREEVEEREQDHEIMVPEEEEPSQSSQHLDHPPANTSPFHRGGSNHLPQYQSRPSDFTMPLARSVPGAHPQEASTPMPTSQPKSFLPPSLRAQPSVHIPPVSTLPVSFISHLAPQPMPPAPQWSSEVTEIGNHDGTTLGHGVSRTTNHSGGMPASPPKSTGSYYGQGTAGPYKLPLFLPSPSSSPSGLANGVGGIRDGGDAGDIIMGDDSLGMTSPDDFVATEQSRITPRGQHTTTNIIEGYSQPKKGKKQQVYVLVPPLPDWARRGKKRKWGSKENEEVEDEGVDPSYIRREALAEHTIPTRL